MGWVKARLRSVNWEKMWELLPVIIVIGAFAVVAGGSFEPLTTYTAALFLVTSLYAFFTYRLSKSAEATARIAQSQLLMAKEPLFVLGDRVRGSYGDGRDKNKEFVQSLVLYLFYVGTAPALRVTLIVTIDGDRRRLEHIAKQNFKMGQNLVPGQPPTEFGLHFSLAKKISTKDVAVATYGAGKA